MHVARGCMTQAVRATSPCTTLDVARTAWVLPVHNSKRRRAQHLRAAAARALAMPAHGRREAVGVKQSA